VRDLPAVLLERTRTILCTTRSTVGTVDVREDGSVDYSENVPGDGTVSARSALNKDKLLSESHEVDQAHMLLPLDGKAIQHTVDWIARQFGVPSTRTSFHSWPAAPVVRPPSDREELTRHLEADDGITLGDFVALVSLV
jgi:hypothetical protein